MTAHAPHRPDEGAARDLRRHPGAGVDRGAARVAAARGWTAGPAGSIAGLAVLMLVAAGVQRRPWGLGLALALQVATIACGLLVPALGLMGVIFAAGLGVPAVPAPGRGAPAGPRRAARPAGCTSGRRSGPAGVSGHGHDHDPARCSAVPPCARRRRGACCWSPRARAVPALEPGHRPAGGRAGPRPPPRRPSRPRRQPVLLARGELISHEHATTGSVQVLGLPDGSRVLRLQDLQTSNGPAAEGVAHRRAGAARHRRLGRVRRRPLGGPRRAQGQHRQLQLRAAGRRRPRPADAA